MNSFETGSEMNHTPVFLHTCFKCPAQFANSSLLVHHIKENHSSFGDPHGTKEVSVKGEIRETDIANRNSTAICPFCGIDCITRKKLMSHLEHEHKDADNGHDGEPETKILRNDDKSKKSVFEDIMKRNLPAPPSRASEHAICNLLGFRSNSTSVGIGTACKVEKGPKFQYKCFWCDMSFRKRGKLMDHIDLLHKHNKQQNQTEAEMLSLDDHYHKQFPKQGGGHAVVSNFHSLMHPIMPGRIQAGPVATSHTDVKKKNNCSFQVLGTLGSTSKYRCSSKRPTTGTCKFYFGKNGNPVANAKAFSQPVFVRPSNNRRYSLPNMFDSQQMQFYLQYRMSAPPTSMASPSIHQSYQMGLRAPLIPPLYNHHMPLIVPPLELSLSQNAGLLEHSKGSQAQYMARLNSMIGFNAMSAVSDRPLDLTKSLNV